MAQTSVDSMYFHMLTMMKCLQLRLAFHAPWAGCGPLGPATPSSRAPHALCLQGGHELACLSSLAAA